MSIGRFAGDSASEVRADGETRTPDPIITRADQLSSEDAPSRGKSYGSEVFTPRRWRPRPPNDRGVEPA